MGGAPTPTKFSGTFRSFGGGSESRDLKSSATGKAPKKVERNKFSAPHCRSAAPQRYGTAGR
jgi:hypothetical protein